VSLLGAIRVDRAYYHCRHCRAGHCPGDALLRLGPGALTAGAREAASLAGALGSFAEAAEKVLPRLAGLRLAESTVERAAEAAGADVGGRLRRGETFGPAQPWPWAADARGDSCAYVSIDATGVGMQGPGGAKAEGRMAYVGLVFTPGTEKGGAEKARAGRARVAAGLCGLAELGERMRRQAGQVGIDSARRWVALTDGGAGLEEFSAVYFPRCECILDFYHAAEHLSGLAKALRPGDEEAAAALAAAWCHALKHEGPAAVLAELRGLDLRGRKREIKETHRLLIGSGHVEAACKAVVGQRMKGNGMRWGEAGADAVCHLRALFKSERGQWDAYWAVAA
jgi:hypothetical protein